MSEFLTTLSNYPSLYKNLPDTDTESVEHAPRSCKADTPQKSWRGSGKKIKSSLCKNFMTQGWCPYRDRCQFAHGSQELRCESSANVAYKTKPCFMFAKKGQCHYGQRCNYLHLKQKSFAITNLEMIQNFPELLPFVGKSRRIILNQKILGRQ